ncbi:MAG: recombinase family protein [Yaniella sp.]|uniref:recombinase family protein n=1 Tax=Yaniella sp. TaxID=2773929 RepID=UPI003F9AC473
MEPRPELDKVLDQLRPGDTLVVWRLERLGRSIRHHMGQLAEFERDLIEERTHPELQTFG